MTQDWKQWEGQMIADAFPLHRYLAGSSDHAVFLSEFNRPAPRQAAIKIVTGNAVEAQLRRWTAASKLSHRHLAQIFDMGRWQMDGAPLVFLVMEYADESLAEVIPVRSLSREEAFETMKPALDALQYVHSRGFIHGHLTPSHIMAAGTCLKITSASLCPAADCPAFIPDDYSPPEKTFAAAGDVWSLGMTLVEALTQRLPAHTPSLASDPAIPDTLPPPFDEMARRALRVDPANRATVSQLAVLLEPSKPQPQKKWAYALAAILGLLVAAIVITPRLLDRQAPSEPIPSAAPAPVQSQPAPVQPAAPPPLQPQPAPIQPAAPAKQPPAAARSDGIVQRVLPRVPQQASRTIHGTVKVSVRVQVDAGGRVAAARLDSSGPSRYFAQLALDAARNWKFTPAPADQAREWLLHFEFSRTGTRVVPVPRHP